MWTKQEINILKKNYGKIPANKIPLKKSESNIWKMAEKLKLSSNLTGKTVHYSYDINFFDNLNILSCYWAGFIAADGYICNNNHSESYILGIRLNKKDKNLLFKLKKDIKFTGPVKIYKNNVCCIRVTLNKKTLNTLINIFKITKKKSLTLRPPRLFRDYALAFICGYIDGDGCISIDKNKYIGLHIIGTRNVLLWMKTIFDKLVPITTKRIANVRQDKYCNIYRYSIVGDRAQRILSILKNIKVLKLYRKWSKV